MDIQQIRYFVAVAEESNFGRAARSLQLTPSPLSRRIRDLENELGSDLFVREYHHVELTRFGQKFLEPARDLLRKFENLKRLSLDPEAPTRFTCRLGAPPLAPPLALDTVLDTFERVAPEVELPITLSSTAELLAKLAHGSIDLAVAHLPVDQTGLESLRLARTGMGIVMRGDDPLAERSSLTMSDMAGRQFLLTSAKVHPLRMGMMHALLAEAGVHCMPELPHNDAVQVGVHISRTGCLGFMVADPGPLFARIFTPPDFTVVPLDEPRLALYVGLAWRTGDEPRVPGLAAVLAELRDTAHVQGLF
ncbi:LysR family transcriptional regulator [Streptomyces sp. GbtcB7]|uniref:LysR family transcriptional regulator n=1 Tax=Streptomyces sp. GbtcB7 TaxID=2824752 RepID=UPI0020C6E681|nr:LysR family transcriptional regulator [Streptomyces sp. GbtcB7]